MADETPARALSTEQLIDELAYLYSTRHRTLRFAPDAELAADTARMTELEEEYQHRMPRREVDSAPGEGDVADEHTSSPARKRRSSLQTDERVDRPTEA